MSTSTTFFFGDGDLFVVSPSISSSYIYASLLEESELRTWFLTL